MCANLRYPAECSDKQSPHTAEAAKATTQLAKTQLVRIPAVMPPLALNLARDLDRISSLLAFRRQATFVTEVSDPAANIDAMRSILSAVQQQREFSPKVSRDTSPVAMAAMITAHLILRRDETYVLF